MSSCEGGMQCLLSVVLTVLQYYFGVVFHLVLLSPAPNKAAL